MSNHGLRVIAFVRVPFLSVVMTLTRRLFTRRRRRVLLLTLLMMKLLSVRPMRVVFVIFVMKLPKNVLIKFVTLLITFAPFNLARRWRLTLLVRNGTSMNVTRVIHIEKGRRVIKPSRVPRSCRKGPVALSPFVRLRRLICKTMIRTGISLVV